MKANSIHLLITDGDFEREVLQYGQPVVVEISAEWCGLCHIIAPVIEEMADKFLTRLKFCRIDMDRGGELAERYGIHKSPAILLFKNGQVVDCIVGAAPRRMIEQKIHALLENEE